MGHQVYESSRSMPLTQYMHCIYSYKQYSLLADTLVVIFDDECHTTADCPDNGTCTAVGSFGQKECVECMYELLHISPMQYSLLAP